MSFTSIALAVIFNIRLFSTSIHAPCWLERACLTFFPDWTSKKILNSTQRGERPLSRTIGTHEAQLYAKLYVLWRVLIKFICSVYLHITVIVGPGGPFESRVIAHCSCCWGFFERRIISHDSCCCGPFKSRVPAYCSFPSGPLAKQSTYKLELP